MNRLRKRKHRKGIVLVIVVVTVVMLALTAYAFCTIMVTESTAARLNGDRLKSKYTVDSGVEYVRLFLTQNEADIQAMGGIWNNEQGVFQAVPVFVDPEDPDKVARFTVITPNLSPEGNSEGFRYGLLDESTRLNLNILTFADTFTENGGRTLLMSLPGMTEETADSIMDWLDPDDEIRDYGMETSYYAGLNPPYRAKNGPLDSIEELLLIKGVTPQLLFGLDSNRNGVLDDDEQYGSDYGSVEPDMLLGWANYITLFSKEHNVNSQGLKRININSDDLEQLYKDLRGSFDEQWTNFIIGYRQNGPYSGGDEPVEGVTGSLDLTKEGKFKFTQVIDLIDATTTITFTNVTDDPVVASPLNTANLLFALPAAMDNLTVQKGLVIPGRINIMQAPRAILLNIPGMTEEIVDEIIYYREFELDQPDGADKNRKYETWILVDQIVDLPTMQTLTPYICARGDVYRAEIVGYFDHNQIRSRAEVVLDTTVPLPRILFWRDKSHLQSGYSKELLGQGYVE